MTAELIHERYGNTLRFTSDTTRSGLYKLLIPQGARIWAVGVRTYRTDEPAEALIAMDAPPVGPGEPVGPDARTTLPRLWAGATLSFYSPPESGTLLISQREESSAFRADRDRWMYLQMSFPSGKVYSWDSQIELHADVSPEPPPLPEPSLELAHRTLDYANKSGLTAALKKTSGSQTDEQLVDWMLRQGDLWFSLCRMVGEAEK